jgi:hypothetical protein
MPRPGENIVRRSGLKRGSAAHHHKAVAQAQGVGPVVGHKDCRNLQGSQKARELFSNALPCRAIERGQRLIEQQQSRITSQRAGQGNPLLLASR